MAEGEDEEVGGPRPGQPAEPGRLGYYYDDGTGYEVYNPEDDAEDEDDSNETEDRAPGGRDS